MIYTYKTEPLTDFNCEKNVDLYNEGLEIVNSYLGKEYPLIINGERIKTNDLYTSLNPAEHNQIIGTIHQASIKEAKLAMNSALEAFKTWKKVSAKIRADVLFKSAAIIRKRKFEFSALMTKEAGKPWGEADADTAEAIDFLEYYGRQMLELEKSDESILSRRNLERNEFKYIPLGVAAVITPWNFPLAILAGMTTAAVVAGNTVVLKPAITTQVIAYKFMEVLEEAGLPKGVVNFIPGDGPEIGEYIVSHPKTRFISFTGSMVVGKKIYENAAKVVDGQIWLKRVIAEMGGKDAIVVDKNIDTEYAAESIVKSAFGFSGQKCSACSRAIIHEDVYDEVVKKIITKTNELKVGNPSCKSMFVGPVTDEKAYNKISEYIEIGKTEGKLVAGGKVSKKDGWFIQPTVFIDMDKNSRLMQEEVFGPVLSVTKVKDFDEALEVANNTIYGLTGAVISNNRFNLEKARDDYFVGNLYFNRKCTGAIVGYQPFGGFNMSGTDSKAGGPDYLQLHMQAKTISEMF
ncbi:L-glutamate gamma-semialdehyde dehydrogenase [Candidatus Izimaplasma bacterium ZiA1]|uniref:L-glutamate gamma-semialdehyde dehydrogenase n=1 Tax=Candidatus Izimoplasma sp. ZiA1 TaxID=2024899 RepID=UPI000BAA4EFA|nr:L-glutamate gamma-semialdehyde dehydrogenase [Candidatus Izimaplasma bacterium ZiA1]